MRGLKNLKKIRTEAGITQSELARRLGVLQASVSYWESGRSDPKLEHILKMTEILKCSTDQLMR